MKIPLTDDDGRFWGPDEAAFHAQFVQHGFSTPLREAARMLLDGGVIEDRAWAWIREKNLGLAALEWDPGQLDRYLARQLQRAEDEHYRYYVTEPGKPEREVTGPEWRAAERGSGFISKGGPERNATAGFTGPDGTTGRIRYRADITQPWKDENA